MEYQKYTSWSEYVFCLLNNFKRKNTKYFINWGRYDQFWLTCKNLTIWGISRAIKKSDKWAWFLQWNPQLLSICRKVRILLSFYIDFVSIYIFIINAPSKSLWGTSCLIYPQKIFRVYETIFQLFKRRKNRLNK